ncbi:MAG: thioredoxin family protein [Ignavibacteria bacterium]|nr:thioredoxin family protein [Ignavibacteria bacterium]
MTIPAVIIAAVILMFFGFQILVITRSRRSRGTRVPGTPGRLGEAVKEGGRVMAYFYSPSCRACRAQTPIIEHLRSRHPNVFSVDASASPETARAFGIMATPSVVIVENGVIERAIVGSRPEGALERALLGSS